MAILTDSEGSSSSLRMCGREDIGIFDWNQRLKGTMLFELFTEFGELRFDVAQLLLECGDLLLELVEGLMQLFDETVSDFGTHLTSRYCLISGTASQIASNVVQPT